MAVILQRIVGAPRGGRFYPDFSGVARSHNFYPAPPMEAGDGIVAVALGMGRAIVEGGVVHRASARATRTTSCSSPRSRTCWRRRSASSGRCPSRAATADGGMREEAFDLAAAEADGALAARRLDLLARERRRLRRPRRARARGSSPSRRS